MMAATDDMPSPAAVSEITVRPPLSRDFSTILEISNWATCHTTANFRLEPETLEHWIDLWNGKPETHPWLVAESDGKVIGFAMASPFAGRCGFAHTAEVSVYVHPDHVSRHIGRTLYHELIPLLRAQGFRTLIAVITKPNPPSERLHAAFGFERVGTLQRVGWKLGKWHDVAFWQLLLDFGDDEPTELKTTREVRRDLKSND